MPDAFQKTKKTHIITSEFYAVSIIHDLREKRKEKTKNLRIRKRGEKQGRDPALFSAGSLLRSNS
jgi:hypothetical protein